MGNNTRGNEMTTATNAAGEILQDQHMAILSAIQYLQGTLDEMTGSVDPFDAEWSDVGKYAKASDLAKEVVQAYEEG
jgi:hypothetical protein